MNGVPFPKVLVCNRIHIFDGIIIASSNPGLGITQWKQESNNQAVLKREQDGISLDITEQEQYISVD